MKKSNILIAVFAVVLAVASVAKAKDLEVDFDGKTSQAVDFKDAINHFKNAINAAGGKFVPMPREAAIESVEPVTPISAGKPGISRKVYDEDGVQASRLIDYLVQVKTPGTDSENTWAVGNDSKVYSIGIARTSPEFAAPKKLAGAVSPFVRGVGEPKARYSCRSGCQDTTVYRCMSGRANECKISQCGTCYINQDHECDCSWDTQSAPHSCRDTGYPCN